MGRTRSRWIAGLPNGMALVRRPVDTMYGTAIDAPSGHLKRICYDYIGHTRTCGPAESPET
jgi:hypothetical protein